VNTQLVPADKIPRKREDLLDPFWRGKGKLLIEDPQANGPGLDVFAVIYEQAGQSYLEAIKGSYLEAIKGQEPTFVRDRDAAPHQIARGEYAMFLPREIGAGKSGLSARWQLYGAHGHDCHCEEWTTPRCRQTLWVSWLVSPDGQRSMRDNLHSQPALPGLAPSQGLPPFSEVNRTKRTPDEIARNSEYIDIFDKIFFR
jgi:ABC-type Fe3+ transport system substrate-binding protein